MTGQLRIKNIYFPGITELMIHYIAIFFVKYCVCFLLKMNILIQAPNFKFEYTGDTNLKKFWQWCIILIITSFLNFIHCPTF
jgi:hypothetical protein